MSVEAVQHQSLVLGFSFVLLLNLEREFVEQKLLSAVLSVGIKYHCDTLNREDKAGAINFSLLWSASCDADLVG